MVANEELPAVIVNPSTPIGPRDVKPTPTGRIIVEAARGRMPGFLDTGLNLVHVDDVAEGHFAALRRGKIGERYILGGENVLLADMLAEIARLVGRRPPRWRIPRAVAIPVAYAAETDGAVHRARAVHDLGRHPHGRPSHVLHRGQGRARSRLPRAALPDALEDAIAGSSGGISGNGKAARSLIRGGNRFSEKIDRSNATIANTRRPNDQRSSRRRA